jgi:hypothetical protein
MEVDGIVSVSNIFYRVNLRVMIINNSQLQYNSYISYDVYNIDIDLDLNDAASVLKRNPKTSISNSETSLLISNNEILRFWQVIPQIQTVTIPRIQIEAQTKITGSDIGDAVFTIYDEFTYYNRQKIPDNTCQPRQTSNVKQTIFRECCPYMISVVRGEGNTLWKKLQYLFDNENTGLPNVYIFYQNIALYGMTKYILSRLLYGKFNINYLLGKYNEKFLNNLSTSRFCAFTKYFDQNDYNKYFMFE